MHRHHGHDSEGSWGTRLLIALSMNLVIPVVQVIVGILAGSMALISDALHNFSDFASLLISYIALRIGRRGPSLTQSFGYRRVEVLAAVFNTALLFGAGLYVAVAAWNRFQHPAPIRGNWVIWAALLGLAANGISTWMLHAGAKENLNMRGAFLHMMVDALTSLGVLLLGILWLFKPWYALDPIVSWVIVVLILYGGWGILKEALQILMNAVPEGIDLETIQREVETLEGVEGLHHLHVWNPSAGTIALAAHIIVPNQMLSDVDELAKKIRALLLSRFAVDHPILQFETRAFASENLLCEACQQDKKNGGESACY